jgi:hypothetical protein
MSLHSAASYTEPKMYSRQQYYLDKKAFESAKDLEDIWEYEFLSNFERHWDYQNHRPAVQPKPPAHKLEQITKKLI